MPNKAVDQIIARASDRRWLMEPESKQLFSIYELPVPPFSWAKTVDDALAFAADRDFPVMVKVISPDIVHKSDKNGVVKAQDRKVLRDAFDRFSRMDGFAGVLVEECQGGVELMVGSKNDPQFGPVVLLGLGGTAVEIYRDISIRLAPIGSTEAKSMIEDLTAKPLLHGFRGSKPIDMAALIDLLTRFSNIVIDLEGVYTSVDLNPVMCSDEGCVIADARIMLKTSDKMEKENRR